MGASRMSSATVAAALLLLASCCFSHPALPFRAIRVNFASVYDARLSQHPPTAAPGGTALGGNGTSARPRRRHLAQLLRGGPILSDLDERADDAQALEPGRGLHSSTSQLNLSRV